MSDAEQQVVAGAVVGGGSLAAVGAGCSTCSVPSAAVRVVQGGLAVYPEGGASLMCGGLTASSGWNI